MAQCPHLVTDLRRRIVDCNPAYGDIRAYWGAACAVAESMRNVAAVGAAPTDGGAEGPPDGSGDLGLEGGIDQSMAADLAQDASADTSVDGVGPD